MQTALNPYISFKDNAREAMTFYESVFGGTLTIAPFKDFNASEDPAENDKVMHAALKINAAFTLMASDTPNAMEYKPGANVSLSLNGDDDGELTAYFAKLAEGGTVTMPLAPAPWGDKFGMLTDKFGLCWMVNITKNSQKS